MNTGELADRFSHPLLRKFILALMQDRFSSLALILVFATFCGDNGGIPAGSSFAMAQRMKQTFLSEGGTILFRKTAQKVNLSGSVAKSVTFTDGSTLPAD